MSHEVARVNMKKQQLRTGNVFYEPVLALFDTFPREEFVPFAFKSFAYSDMQIPLPHEQCMMTPLEEALLLQSLALQGHEVVLEVGTGTGFLTAMLSRMCKKVVSVDYYADFTAMARRRLDQYQCTNVELLTGDASSGWLDKAPYDVIVFTGAFDALNKTQRLQILPGGKLFAIIGKASVMQAQLHTFDHSGQWHEQFVFETRLPPLIDALKPHPFVF
ncbi:MAG TPA: protein-L-isoaspartate O-methyltransferase [Legionella sp.]|nr:protein-L-isoaspartate O-methyltransferase [Legionella sp.]